MNILLILSQDEINFVQYYDEFCALKLLLFLTQIFRQRKTSTKLIRKIEISEVARIRKKSWIWVREAFNQIQSIPEMLCITPNPSTSVEQRYQCYLESVLASSDWHHFTAFYFTLSPPEFLAFITCSLRPDQMPHISWLNNN